MTDDELEGIGVADLEALVRLQAERIDGLLEELHLACAARDELKSRITQLAGPPTATTDGEW